VNVTLVMVKADGSMKEIPIDREVVTIGRDDGMKLRIPVSSVSRRHCELRVTSTGVLIKDLGSSNGTFVNGHKVRDEELEAGDLVGVGPVVFVVRIDGEPRHIDAKDCYAAGSVGLDDDDDDFAAPTSDRGTVSSPARAATPPPAPAPAPASGSSKPPAIEPAAAKKSDDDEDDDDISDLLKDFDFGDDDDEPKKP
jgi:predicted component of type VI protein secretion system